jgi:ribonuclease HII
MSKVRSPLKSYYLDGNKLEIGLDETGKGCYFGRIYSGAVIWDPEMSHPLIRDSKDLSHRQRLVAYDYIKENAPAYGFGWAEAEEIDKININQANIQSMYRAIKACQIIPEHIIIDGDQKAFSKFLYTVEGMSINFSTIIKGDTLFYSIAGASIVAKVERDKYIEELCDEYPYLNVYNLKSNKGYGAKVHEDALANWGISKWHRLSYRPVQEHSSKIYNG